MTESVFFPSNQTDIYTKLLALITAFRFEEALRMSRQYGVLPSQSDMDCLIDNLAKQKESAAVDNSSHRLDIRIKALKRLRDNGCDPQIIVEKIILPEGYKGKILLVMMMGGVLDGQVCLRSGDMWHREILRNTENEIEDLGFLKSSVCELGGAHVRFEKNNDIVIFGTSDDFGSCDKVCAAMLIQQFFKERTVRILD